MKAFILWREVRESRERARGGGGAGEEDRGRKFLILERGDWKTIEKQREVDGC